jgi:hypothetical protein
MNSTQNVQTIKNIFVVRKALKYTCVNLINYAKQLIKYFRISSYIFDFVLNSVRLKIYTTLSKIITIYAMKYFFPLSAVTTLRQHRSKFLRWQLMSMQQVKYGVHIATLHYQLYLLSFTVS